MNDDIELIIPPKGISDEDFEACRKELKVIDKCLADMEKLYFEYAEAKSMLGMDDGDEDEYYEARMIVALHGIADGKKIILNMHEGKFPGFYMRYQSEIIANEIKEFSGINEDLLGPAEEK